MLGPDRPGSARFGPFRTVSPFVRGSPDHSKNVQTGRRDWGVIGRSSSHWLARTCARRARVVKTNPDCVARKGAALSTHSFIEELLHTPTLASRLERGTPQLPGASPVLVPRQASAASTGAITDTELPYHPLLPSRRCRLEHSHQCRANAMLAHVAETCLKFAVGQFSVRVTMFPGL